MRCLVVGASGQDGTLLSAQLLAEGHAVTAVSRTRPLLHDLDWRRLDVVDRAAIGSLVAEIVPDELYYLAAYHRSSQDATPTLEADVAGSFSVNMTAFAGVLTAVAHHSPATRVVYASSCRVFGLGDGRLLDESAERRPVCPYGASKSAAMSIADLYRREQGLFVVSAILFNHESELRPPSFLSKKLALAALAARNDPAVTVTVGSLDDEADWGAARDFMAALRALARCEVAGDFVVASGQLRTVRDFAAASFGAVGLDWERHVRLSPVPARPRWRLTGDSTKLSKCTGWGPTCRFEEMVADLVTRAERHERERSSDFHSYL
jgi:GDPmannose 4,6-dehydratase